MRRNRNHPARRQPRPSSCWEQTSCSWSHPHHHHHHYYQICCPIGGGLHRHLRPLHRHYHHRLFPLPLPENRGYVEKLHCHDLDHRDRGQQQAVYVCVC